MAAIISTMLSLVLNKFYQRVSEGEKLSPYKIHAIWAFGACLPKDFSASAPKSFPAMVRMQVMIILTQLWFVFERYRWESGFHKDIASSALRWRIIVETDKRNARMRQLETDGKEDMRVLWSDSEAFEASLSTGSPSREAGMLLADCHGCSVLDKDRLNRLEEQTSKKHKMATISDMLEDGLSTNKHDRRRITHNGADGWYRDEVGPWQYTFVDDDDNEVTLGYQGTISTIACQDCGSHNLDKHGMCTECGYHPQWDIQWDGFNAENKHYEATTNGYLADERKERGNRFCDEWERANECPDNRIIHEYKAAWVRYRAKQLEMGIAAKKHGKRSLLSHGHLTKHQWEVIEMVYASRAGRTKQDKYGRPNIAYERLPKQEVLKWAELARSLL